MKMCSIHQTPKPWYMSSTASWLPDKQTGTCLMLLQFFKLVFIGCLLYACLCVLGTFLFVSLTKIFHGRSVWLSSCMQHKQWPRKRSQAKMRPGCESPSFMLFSSHFRVNLYTAAGVQLRNQSQYRKMKIIISPLRLTCRQPFTQQS